MADYGDVSGGNSDQAIRDIVAQLVGAPQTAPATQAAQSAPAATMPAPEVTPSITSAVPGAPLDITPNLPTAAPRAKGDDWVPASPTMVAPPVSSMGMLAAAPRSAAPAMGGVLVVSPRR